MKTSPSTKTPVPGPVSTTQPSAARRILFFLAFGLVLLAITGGTYLLYTNNVNSSLNVTRHEGKALVAGVTVAPFLSLPTDGLFPVGLARNADGTFYLSMFGAGTIDHIDADGTRTAFVRAGTGISAAGPLALGPDNNLYAIDYSEKTSNAVGSLKRITPDGKVSAFGTPPGGSKGISLFAQLTFDDVGNLYVTDPATAQIWRFLPDGTGSVWWTAPAVGANNPVLVGIAFDAQHKALVVSDVGTYSLYRVDLAGDTHSSILLYRPAQPLDVRSLTLDDQGRILLAIWQNDNGTLARLDINGQLTKLADGFRTPTTVLYHAGKAYIVNADIFAVYTTQVKAKLPFTVDVVDLSKTDAGPQ